MSEIASIHPQCASHLHGLHDVRIDSETVGTAMLDGLGCWFVFASSGAPVYRGRPGQRMARAIRAAAKLAELDAERAAIERAETALFVRERPFV